MRQAGRYLPEYRALRKQTPNFLEFCYTPSLAVEATLQPIERFGMDAAIIFSDILVIPDALGVAVRFEEGHGPLLTPVDSEKSLEKLDSKKLSAHLAPVYAALAKTKAALPKETALIGFCGAPWTLACYTVQGKSSKDFAQVKDVAKAQPKFFGRLITLFSDAVIIHAKAQIEAGAEIIQLFDSWAGVLAEEEFAKFVIAPTKKIVAAIKAAHPDVPVIGFPRQAGVKTLAYVAQTGLQAVSIDGSVPLEWARDNLQPVTVVQGCLDQLLLADDKAKMLEEAKKILSVLGDKAFVFNLAHGILPHTPPEHVQALCEFLKQYRHD
jgi:uroporphyrinogen decarboxylase